MLPFEVGGKRCCVRGFENSFNPSSVQKILGSLVTVREKDCHGNTHTYSLYFQEDSSLEGLLPDSKVRGQLYPEGVALTVADQNAEAQRLIVLLFR